MIKPGKTNGGVKAAPVAVAGAQRPRHLQRQRSKRRPNSPSSLKEAPADGAVIAVIKVVRDNDGDSASKKPGDLVDGGTEAVEHMSAWAEPAKST